MRILVIGGTQFMGRITVNALLEAGHDVTLLNRGRTSNPFEGHPRLQTIKCDRIADRQKFRDAVRSVGHTDVVVDFIGFQEAYLQDTVEALTEAETPGEFRRSATRHYIFISTDSIYWAQKLPGFTGRLSEDVCQDFSTDEFQKHVDHCKQTALGEYQLRYGGNKLGCERVLSEAWDSIGFPYTILRLPDVYGQFDNLGGFWEIVMAIEIGRPIPLQLPSGRIRSKDQTSDGYVHRFSWAFAEDVRDAIVACISKGDTVHGQSMHVAHEEAVSLQETAVMIAEAMQRDPSSLKFDHKRDAALPSTDFGALDVSRALHLLRPWRPTAIRVAVARAVSWFLSSKENRRHHRLVHREQRFYDETVARRFATSVFEVKSCWAGSADRAALLSQGPLVLCDALPNFTGPAVLSFMQRLMDQVGDTQVRCELQRGLCVEAEAQSWALRHFAGHLLRQSQHSLSYRLPASRLLEATDLLGELRSPLWDLHADDTGTRLLHLGGPGARSALWKSPLGDGDEEATGAGGGGVGGGGGAADEEARAAALEVKAQALGFWDCALLGRRKWRLYPPETPPSRLCLSMGTVDSGAASRSSSGLLPESESECSGSGLLGRGPSRSPVDSFFCGPELMCVSLEHSGFSPSECWECEQAMGDCVVVPRGWWYQAYDDDRTLSVSATFGPALGGPTLQGREGGPGPKAATASGSRKRGDSPEVIDFEVVD